MKSAHFPLSRLAVLFFCFNLFYFTAYSQVGIGTTNPDANAKLDITSTAAEPGGLLLPRMALTAINSPSPLVNPVPAGMTVYNTVTAGTGVNQVTPGFYYYDGTRWVRLASSAQAQDNWSLTGNAGTNSGTNFLGTTDNVHFETFTNNASRMRVQNSGQITIGFGAGMANAGQQLNVGSTFLNGVAIGGYSGNQGSGVYGQNVGEGIGVHGINASGGVGVQGESFDGSGFSVFGVDGPVVSDNIRFGTDAFFGLTRDNVSNALWGVNQNASGVGILGSSNSISVYPTGGVGVAGSGSRMGVYGYAGAGSVSNANRGNAAGSFTLDTDSDPGTNGINDGYRASAKLAGFDNVSPDGSANSRNSYFGGYFSGGNESNGSISFAYAGMKYNVNGTGTTGTNYKIIGNGTNSTLISDAQGIPRIMFSPEAPEILFQDYGIGKLVNGQARINIDPILKQSLYVDNEYPLKVFVTLEGDCNGVYVTDKSIDGFTVKELQDGKSNVSFSWQIVANRADDKDANGNISSKHVGLRLPIGPGPLSTINANMKHYDKIYDLDRNDRKGVSKNQTEETLSEEELAVIRQNISGKTKAIRKKKTIP